MQEGLDTAPHASCLSDDLLYLAGPELRGVCGEAIRDLGKINPSLFYSLFGRGSGGTCPLSPPQ